MKTLEAARRQMTNWAKQGYFNGDPNSYSDLQPIGSEYVDTVWKLLHKLGYLSK